MNNLAIIPARGGSKGIPRKNAVKLAGKPLLAWSLEAARGARCVDRIVVSTDDEELAAITERWGGEVVWRPQHLAGDTASSESALLHVLEELKRAEEYQPEITVFLQCTSPLTSSQDIDGVVTTLCDEGADTALAAAPFHYFLWRPNSAGCAEGINHEQRVRLRRQDRPPEYIETGAVYAMKTRGFLEAKHRFFGKTVLFETSSSRRLEIDEPGDLALAQALLNQMGRASHSDPEPPRVQALVLDFDGVLTDNRVNVDQEGRESVACNRSDGLALQRLREAGIPVLVISGESNPVVEARCRKLRVEVRSGTRDKLPVLDAWLKSQALTRDEAAYVGNDTNDVECLAAVGCGMAVADAFPDAKRTAHFTLDSPGGGGAVREAVELILNGLPSASRVVGPLFEQAPDGPFSSPLNQEMMQ